MTLTKFSRMSHRMSVTNVKPWTREKCLKLVRIRSIYNLSTVINTS